MKKVITLEEVKIPEVVTSQLDNDIASKHESEERDKVIKLQDDARDIIHAGTGS